MGKQKANPFLNFISISAPLLALIVAVIIPLFHDISDTSGLFLPLIYPAEVFIYIMALGFVIGVVSILRNEKMLWLSIVAVIINIIPTLLAAPFIFFEIMDH